VSVTTPENPHFHQPDFEAHQHFSELSPEKQRQFAALVKLAETAKAYPHQSGYHVRTAALAEDGTTHAGGNKEDGFSDAFVHGETAVISGLRDKTASPIEALAWNFVEGKGSPAEFGRPCGRCRDRMLEYCGPELVLLTGNDQNIIYTKLKDFLFTEFSPLSPEELKITEVRAALTACEHAVDVYLPADKKKQMYGAVLVSADGTFLTGAHYSNAGFDSTSPGLGAVAHWRNSYPHGTVSEQYLNLEKLILVGQHGIPQPLYRDRQAVLEMDELLRRYNPNRAPLRVELVHAVREGDGMPSIVKAVLTDAKEWLPHPFTPGEFRQDDVLEAQLEKLIKPVFSA
jgi:cytidine deaminase